MSSQLLAGVISDDRHGIHGYATIRDALQHAADALTIDVKSRWIPSTALRSVAELEIYDALWFGPGGPYENSDGVLTAIRFARERALPFLGTCAGFQHAAIEFARSVLGLTEADHAESNPTTTQPLISALAHPLFERTAAVVLDPHSRTAAIYGRTFAAERYRCRFGLNPDFLASLHGGGLRVTGVDEMGLATVVEFPDHPFFVATLFMPELSSRTAAPHPLVTAYLRAAAANRKLRS